MALMGETMENTEVVTETTPENNTQTELPIDDSVSAIKFREAQKKAQALESDIAKLRSELEAKKRSELKSKEDFKALAEQAEKEAGEWKSKYDMTWTWLEREKKFTEIKSLALAAGLQKEALEVIDKMDFEDVEIEKTTTGRINVLGADRAVAKLKAQMPFLFTNKSVKVNSETPSAANGSDGKVTMETITKLQKEYAKSPTRENGEALKAAYIAFQK